MKKVALQMYSIRDLMSQDVFAALKSTAEAGYTGVEFAGFYGVPAGEMKKALGNYGLAVSGAHLSVNDFTDETYALTVEYNHTIGNKNLVMAGLPSEMTGSAENWKRSAEYMNSIGDRLAKEGFSFYYHNHYHEFNKYNGVSGLDILFGNTEPRLLGMELDTYWVRYAGADPAEVMEKYKERCGLLHIKDMLPRDDKRCTEVGYGIMDFRKIINLAKKYGTEWYIVEQETFDIPETESITKSAQWLIKNT